MKKILLTQGKYALVDDADFKWLNQWKWHAVKRGKCWYARRGSAPQIYMHRLIMNNPEKMDIDHINDNGLDNQRHNLRICTHRQNLQNSRKRINATSKYKGTYYAKIGERRKRWVATICGRAIGYFSTEKEAALAYDDAAKRNFGLFARTNF